MGDLDELLDQACADGRMTQGDADAIREFIEFLARPDCSHCPRGCKSCEPDSCECYTHQDWPDKRFPLPDATHAESETPRLDAIGEILDIMHGKSTPPDAAHAAHDESEAQS